MKAWLFVVMSGIMLPILICKDNDEKAVIALYVELQSENPTNNIPIPVANAKMVNAYVVHGRATELPYPFYVLNSEGNIFFVKAYQDYLSREESFS